jgi:DNA-directed RNA polymerase subunit RPC12/RpoP
VMGLLLESLVALRGTGQEGPGPKCAECGQEMRYKGLKERGLATSVGEIDLERAYFYCPDCRQGFFPPGPRTEGAAGGVE